MNTGMYDNPVTQQNLRRCANGASISSIRRRAISPVATPAAASCRTRPRCSGALKKRSPRRISRGGACWSPLDRRRRRWIRVPFLSNHSTGKMGYAVAARAALRGAETTLVSGPTALDTPAGVQRVDVVSAREMYDAVVSRAAEQDMIVKAAAVGDYRPAETAAEKLKKGEGELTLALARNPDILAELGRKKRPGQFALRLRDGNPEPVGERRGEAAAEKVAICRWPTPCATRARASARIPTSRRSCLRMGGARPRL